MSARVKAKHKSSLQDASSWRHFLTNAPPLNDLIEIRRLQDNKTILRQRGELPPTLAARRSEWRPH